MHQPKERNGRVLRQILYWHDVIELNMMDIYKLALSFLRPTHHEQSMSNSVDATSLNTTGKITTY